MKAYQVYHLNLAFSSIPAEARGDVIERCYWPLLHLAQKLSIPVGIELTGWTLSQIQQLAPGWVEQFKALLLAGQCELIGSGWAQIIGPVVPVAVNRWNQRLGLEAYAHILGQRPRLALVNEMAFSTSLVNLYADAGYTGIIMDRDNVRLALGLDYKPLTEVPTHALGHAGVELPVLWSDSNLFQRLQRAVHGDIRVSDYVGYVSRRAANDGCVLPIYCNDAEIFDYRPGRFTAESRLHPEGEWSRMERIMQALVREAGVSWASPSAALAETLNLQPKRAELLSSSQHPAPVKKQAKYNINRWSLTGRDDLWLNSACHRIHDSLIRSVNDDPAAWRELCERWASDLRTHITEARWQEQTARLANELARHSLPRASALATSPGLPADVESTTDGEGILHSINTPTARIALNLRRGMTMHSLAFRKHNFEPILGTLEQGFFESIELGADFYSGGVLVEIPGERKRLTDLEWVQMQTCSKGDIVCASGTLPFGSAQLAKCIELDARAERIALEYEFKNMERPLGLVRVGVLTLLPQAWQLPLTCRTWLGGDQPEDFLCESGTHHGKAASTLVSSTSALGSAVGHLELRDARGRGLCIKWTPASCPVVPMLQHLSTPSGHLTRLSFSLAELDDTSRSGGHLLPVRLEITPL